MKIKKFHVALIFCSLRILEDSTDKLKYQGFFAINKRNTNNTRSSWQNSTQIIKRVIKAEKRDVRLDVSFKKLK